MTNQFKNIVIVGRQDDSRVKEPLKLLKEHLSKVGAKLLPAESMDTADLAIAIGGDGTMLYASRLTRDTGTPILGINRGRLGFLADVTPDEMITSVDHVLNGNYTTDSRLTLEARLRLDTKGLKRLSAYETSAAKSLERISVSDRVERYGFPPQSVTTLVWEKTGESP